MSLKGLAIVADDLTGAMDSSGHFANLGFSTVVHLAPEFPYSAEVVAVTTNSRAEEPEVAGNSVRQAIKGLAERIIYKKIDSTLRGNIGVELDAILESRMYEKVLVAPAFPSMGRTIEAGVLLVDGVPVSKTSFANDPILPVSESHIPTLLESSMSFQVGCVGIPEIEAGPEFLYRQVSAMDRRIVVCDAKQQRHLTTIIRAAILARDNWLLCGSTGLARETHLLIEKQNLSRAEVPIFSTERGVLVLVGSRNPISRNQLEFARKSMGLPIINVDTSQLLQEETKVEMMGEILEKARRIFPTDNLLAISLSISSFHPGLKHTLPGFLAEVAAQIVGEQRIGGLFLCGGDIAVEVCRRLAIPAISVQGEIEPGIPAGVAMGDQAKNIGVVTKAGGFGGNDSLIKSINYLEKGEIS